MKASFQKEMLRGFFLWITARINGEDNIKLYKDEPIDVGSNSQSSQATNVSDIVYSKSAILKCLQQRGE